MKEQVFKIIFDNAMDGILLADIETKKFYIGNKMIFQMLGYDPEEMENITVMDIHPQEDLPYVIERFEKQVRKEIQLAKDIPMKRKDGSVFYADINSCPIVIDGKIYLAGYFRDVTERKEAEEEVRTERQRLYDVLETLPAYVILLAPDYHVRFANRFFRERFGESHGKRCFEYLFHRTEPCEICETYTVLKTNATHQWEWTGPDSRNYDIYDFPFADTDGSTLILEMGIDITERRRAEEEIQKRVKELEDFYDMAVGRELRMKELKEQLEEMKEEMEKLKKELEKCKKQ